MKNQSQLSILKIEEVAIDTVHPNPYNPNRQSDFDFQLLLKSMKEDGFTQPILVQQQTMEIIDGEHRWRAAKQLGFTTIPVAFTTMTPQQMRVATLRHNRARGEEDVQLTAQLLRDLESIGSLAYAQKALQLDDVEIQRLINDIPAPEGMQGDEYSISWIPKRDGKLDQANSDLYDMTPNASDRLRQFTAELDKAKTEKEREQVRKELGNTFRLNLVYTNDEAKTVRQALGPEPAKKILEICLTILGRNIRDTIQN